MNVKESRQYPLVSIISGYFNRENQVLESIYSLINQTYRNLEIIIFDDCSTDNTFEELKKLAKLDKRIILIKHKENKGFVKGLIDAVQISRGDFIAIHGSGDISYPTRIEKQLNHLTKFKSISIVGCHYLNMRDKIVMSHVKPNNSSNFTKNLLKRNIFSHGEVMFRRLTYTKVGGYRSFFEFSQDYDLWCRMSLVSDYFIVEETLYERNNDSKNAVSNNSVKLIRQAILEQFVRQCLQFRIKNGFDHIDIYDNQALAFRKKSVKLSLKIFYKFLLGLESKHERSELDKVWTTIKSEGISLARVLIYLVYYRIIPISITFKVMNRTIKFLNKLIVR